MAFYFKGKSFTAFPFSFFQSVKLSESFFQIDSILFSKSHLEKLSSIISPFKKWHEHCHYDSRESGVDPLVKDREGFLKRTLKRIEKERTFVVFEDGKLIFKADIVCEAEDVYYLEGIYTAPEMRGKGIGASCLAKLSLELLNRKQHICLLTNADFKPAHRSLEKAGYKNTGNCIKNFV